MSSRALSDEVLRNILSACLTISPDILFKFPTQIPRDLSRPRNSHLLLVSRQWLKIGRPLLYSSLKLSKTGHTRNIAIVLKNDRRLGSAIRYLRLESCYCKELLTIADLGSNIEAIYVNLEVNSSDSIVGLKKSLPMISPKVMYIHQLSLFGLRKQNKNIEDLRGVVEGLINKRWTNLTHVYLSDTFPMSSTLAVALQKAPNMEELSISTADVKEWLSSPTDRASLQAIVQNPKLNAVKCRGRAAQKAVCDLFQDIPSMWATSALFIFVQ